MDSIQQSNQLATKKTGLLEGFDLQSWGLYSLLGLISLFYIFIAGQKVLGAEKMLARMAELHYPWWATRLIGLVELSAVFGLWWHRTRTLALSSLILIMAGAAGSHIAYGHPMSQWGVVFVIALFIGGTAILDRGKQILRFLLRTREWSSRTEGSSATKWLRTCLLAILTLGMLFLGGQKLFAVEPMASRMAEINFGGMAMHLIGLIEVTAAALFWFEKTRTPALVSLLPIVAGGAGAHFGAGHGMARATGAFVVALVVASALFTDRGKNLLNFLLRKGPSAQT